MGEKKAPATKKIVPMFLSMYETYHPGQKYLVNWPLLKAAEKVGTFYSQAEVGRAIEYYFRTRSRHDLWEFIENLDKIYMSAKREEAAKGRVEDMIRKTNERMRHIEHGSSPDNQGS
jgi:hypothetical protein